MRIAHLAACAFDAALLEESIEESAQAAHVVWTAHGPEQLLAALDHEPDILLLDMRWGDAALSLGKTFRQVGGIQIFCRFTMPDGRLEEAARSLGFSILQGSAPWSALLGQIGGAV